MLTKLDAVNACLAGIGLAPVSTVDEANLDLDAASALQVVERLTIHLQARGWWFNEEGSWRITPDTITGYVAVPNTALSFITSGDSRHLKLSIRDSKVYDLENHTFDLRSLVYTPAGSTIGYIEFTMITALSFEDLPPVARIAVGYTARRQFAQDMEVDERRWKFQREEEATANNQLISEDSRNKKRNSITGNPRIVNFLLKAGGPNSYQYLGGL